MRSLKKFVATGAFVFGLLTPGLTAVASPAVASVGTTPQAASTTICPPSQSYASIVKNYYRGSTIFPLRCGNGAFGYRHFSDRWNAEFSSMITLTVSRGVSGGTGVLYYIPRACASPTFKVVYNLGAYNGNGIRPQGIITATYENQSAITPRGCEPI